MKSISQPTHEEITERARKIWIQAGRTDGYDLDHWIQAENELRKERQYAMRDDGDTGKKRTEHRRQNGK